MNTRLVGTAEVAEILGVSKQRVAQLRANADFPRPVQILRATAVWLENDMRHYATSRNTKPGPRPGR